MTDQTSSKFTHPENITVGLARVIYEDDTWYGLKGWRLLGMQMTQNRDEAYAYCVRMDQCRKDNQHKGL